jgi:hypothetical protein
MEVLGCLKEFTHGSPFPPSYSFPLLLSPFSMKRRMTSVAAACFFALFPSFLRYSTSTLSSMKITFSGRSFLKCLP